jgi:hypothetical protein
MITLNSERGPISVQSWDEVTSIVGFVDGVDPKERKLQAILGRYIFPELRACGLASCRTPHGRGFIVDIGAGQVTNIGKDCGKIHFGVDFEVMSRQFVRDDQRRNRIETLQTFQSRIPHIRGQIEKLRKEGGGDIVVKAGKLLRSSDCPGAIRETLSRMIRTRDDQVTVERLETQEDADAREALSNARPASQEDDIERKATRRLVRVPVAALDGLSFF